MVDREWWTHRPLVWMLQASRVAAGNRCALLVLFARSTRLSRVAVERMWLRVLARQYTDQGYSSLGPGRLGERLQL